MVRHYLQPVTATCDHTMCRGSVVGHWERGLLRVSGGRVPSELHPPCTQDLDRPSLFCEGSQQLQGEEGSGAVLWRGQGKPEGLAGSTW